MNSSMIMISRSRLGRVVALWGCCGCGSGVVGVDPCIDSSGECTALPLEKKDAADESPLPNWEVEEVVLQPVAELPLDWVKRLPGPVQPFGQGSSAAYYRVLRADEAGKLVLFFRGEDTQTLNVARLDDAGEVVQMASVAAPDDWAGGADTQVGFSSCGSAFCGSDPLGLKVSWFTLSSTLNPPRVQEKLNFVSDISQPPQRMPLVNGVLDDMLQGANGDVYVIKGDPDHNVTKLDANGRELWKDSEIAGSPYVPERSLVLSGIRLDDDSLVVLRWPMDEQVSYLTFFDSAGGRQDTFTILPPAGHLLNAGNYATLVAANNGDLSVIKLLDPEHSHEMRFLRNDYTLLRPEAAAIDPSGNVYFGTHNGSRLGAEPTLCRAAESGGGTCYTLPLHLGADTEEFRFDGIVARADGDLYIHSGFDLVHVKFPR